MSRRRDLFRPDLSSTRAKDEYLKDCHVIFFIGRLLGYAVDNKMRNIHGKLMESVRCGMGASENTACDECSIANLIPCPYPRLCKKWDGGCSFHKSPAEMCRPCPNRICDKRRENIENMHVNKRPNWRFTRAQSWCTDHNELVKCYMPERLSRLPPTMDITSFVFVIKNNTELNMALSSSNVSFDRLRHIRNKMAHSQGETLSNFERTELLCMKQKLYEFISDDLNDEDRVQEDHAPSFWNNFMTTGYFECQIPYAIQLCCGRDPGLLSGWEMVYLAIFLLPVVLPPTCFKEHFSMEVNDMFMLILIVLECIHAIFNLFKNSFNKLQRITTRLSLWCRRIRTHTAYHWLTPVNVVCLAIVLLLLLLLLSAYFEERFSKELCVSMFTGIASVLAIYVLRNVVCNSRAKDLEEKTNRIVEAGFLNLRVQSAELIAENIRDFKNKALAHHTSISSQIVADNTEHEENMKRMQEEAQSHLRNVAAEILSETVHEFSNEALAHHMEINQTPARVCTMEDAKHELRRRLARFYHDIKVSPFISQKTKFDLSDFYVRSRMHFMDKTQWSLDDGRDRNEVKSFKDMLYLNNSQARHVFLLGDSGEGKSILNLKLALDWCHQYLNCAEHTENESEESSLFFDGDQLKTFEYLFYIDLKGCTRECEIDDIIKERLIFKLYSFHEREYAYKLVEEVLNTERCVIVADNTEEWIHPTKSTCLSTERCFPVSVQRPLCTFMFTMRPWLFFQNCSVVPDEDIVIKVSGVSDTKQLVSKIIVILQKAFPTQRDCSSMEFKRYLIKRQFESLLSNPMYLVYLVCLWYEEDNWAVFDSRCKMFSRLIRLNLSKQTVCSQAAENAEVFPQFLQGFIDQTTSEFLRSVSCLAFEAYTAARTRDIENSLVNEHLDPQTFEQALDIGILSLTSKHSFTTCQPKTIYYFTNPTMQDFLTVLYLFSKRENNGGDVGPRPMSFHRKTTMLDCAHIFIFSCAMVPEYANALSVELNESLPNTSKTKSGYDAYEFEVAKPASKTVLYLQELFVAGYEEAHANGVDTNKLKLNLSHFIFGHLNQSDKACNILKKFLLLNEESVASLDVTGQEDIIDDSVIAAVLSKSKRSLTSLRLVKRFGIFDLSQCTNLKSLCICYNDTNHAETILHDRRQNYGLGLEKLSSCSLHNVSPRTQEKIFNSIKNGMLSELENFIICKCHDVKLLCEALQKVSNLKYLYVEDIQLTSMCLPINSCITRITFHNVILTEDVLENLLKMLTSEPKYEECALNITNCIVLERHKRLSGDDTYYLPQRKRKKFKKSLHVKVVDTEMKESMDEWLRHFAEMLKKRMACQLEMSNVKYPERVF